jgi:hypothetical protein
MSLLGLLSQGSMIAGKRATIVFQGRVYLYSYLADLPIAKVAIMNGMPKDKRISN